MQQPNILFLDFETFYSTAQAYTLRKMTIPCYLLDPRFEVSMCAVRELGPSGWHSHVVDGPDFGEFIAGHDPTNTATVTFNALFDNSILAWHYGWVPQRMLDPMGMARALLGHKLKGFSLDTIAKHELGRSKLGTITKVDGMTRAQIKSSGLWDEFCTYALWDVDACADIFWKLLPDFPVSEQKLMDLVLRCTVQPRFLLDEQLLTAHLQETRDKKAALLRQCNIPDDASLMSQQKFVGLLEAAGVTVQYKTNAKGKDIPALARTDQFMADLQEHDDPLVQALAAARIGVKSTLEETRCKKLLDIAHLPWQCYRDGNMRIFSGGNMPIPLRYAGAHTHRLSGDWSLNMQNLPRGSNLRKALMAPPGFSVVSCDLAQIEARLVAWLARCMKLLASFERGDPYSDFASLVFGFPVDKKRHPVHRFIGKTGVLGLGYGCGVDRFFDMVIKSARLLGIDMDAIGGFTPEQASETVGKYRTEYKDIPKNAWGKLDGIMSSTWLPPVKTFHQFGPVEIGHGCVHLPNDLWLRYDNPRYETGEYLYDYGRVTGIKLYGAKFLENIVQAIARIIVMNAALRLDRLGIRFVLQAHDELVFLIHNSEIDITCRTVHREMTRRPSWAPELPLGAEVKVGPSYGTTKLWEGRA